MSLRGVECVLAVIGTGGPVKRSNTKSSFTWKTAPRSTHMRAPITEGEREYTRSGHQSQKGRANIPVAGTNRRRGGLNRYSDVARPAAAAAAGAGLRAAGVLRRGGAAGEAGAAGAGFPVAAGVSGGAAGRPAGDGVGGAAAHPPVCAGEGYIVDAKGYIVDAKGYIVDAKGYI
eukprot:1181783-Prorocentrum_minimum.AAC.3